MTTSAQPIIAVEGAVRLLRVLRPHLAEDAVWVLTEGEEDVDWLRIYADVKSGVKVREHAAEVLNDLWSEGTPFAVLFEPKKALTVSLLKSSDGTSTGNPDQSFLDPLYAALLESIRYV